MTTDRVTTATDTHGLVDRIAATSATISISGRKYNQSIMVRPFRSSL